VGNIGVCGLFGEPSGRHQQVPQRVSRVRLSTGLLEEGGVRELESVVLEQRLLSRQLVGDLGAWIGGRYIEERFQVGRHVNRAEQIGSALSAS
jgi:hypothetical protein